jgi:hypothetical protein
MSAHVYTTLMAYERTGHRGPGGPPSRRCGVPPSRSPAVPAVLGAVGALVNTSGDQAGPWGRVVPDRANDRTFPYRFKGVRREAHCHGRVRSGKPKPRWGRRWGACLGEGQTTQGRPTGDSDGVALSQKNCLEPGGAFAPPLVSVLGSEWVCVDCQVPSRNWCLPLRDGAAGPERSFAPRPYTLALGQRLEQSIALHFRRFRWVCNTTSEPLISLHLGVCGGIRATRCSGYPVSWRRLARPFTFETVEGVHGAGMGRPGSLASRGASR